MVDLLVGNPGAQLIVTDVLEKFFPQLRDEFRSKDVQIQYICTGGDELEGIPDNTIDYLVCNYTLSVINSEASFAALALRRFWEVLKYDGTLFVEEEFPISKQITLPQQVWAEKWCVLK